MTQVPYRANLSAAIFPMTIARAGRSVIIPQADQNFDRRVDPSGEQTDAGIPQIIYGENILPTEQGYQSVGYAALGTNFPAQETVRPTIRLQFKNVTLLFAPTQIYASYRTGWTEVVISGTYPGVIREEYISAATVRGEQYLQIWDQLYTISFDALTDIFTLTNITATVTPSGFMANVRNICSSYNYLIALAADGTVYWSSTLTATDFVPSLVTGSGSGLPEQLGTVLRSNSSGFFLFGDKITSVTYTGNARYPWRFRVLPGSEGPAFIEYLAGDPYGAAYIVLGKQGNIYSVTPDGVQAIGEQLSEVVRNLNYHDSFDYATNTFSVVPETETLKYRVSFLQNRYVLLSEKPLSGTQFESIYVYDVKFNRYGKLKVAHTTVTESDSQTIATMNDIKFIHSINGTTSRLSFDVHNDYLRHSGVLLLGKLQYIRSRFLCLDEVSVESPTLFQADTAVKNFSAFAIPTLDGKTFLPSVPLFLDTARTGGGVMSYFSSVEGKNVSLLFKGAFDLVSVDLKFHVGGKF